MTKASQLPQTLLEAVRYFADPANCRAYLVSRRWPEGVLCPQCGSKAVYFDSSRNGWECKTRHPRRKFTLKTGTIFEDSALGLDKWLPCVWMIANAKNGISSHEIARALGVTQKTAWFMLQRIRLAMQDDTIGGGNKMSGTIEADETFIGGKQRHRPRKFTADGPKRKPSGPFAGKVIVQGILERASEPKKSQIRTMVIPHTKKSVIGANVREHVEVGADLMTDALHSYKHLGREFNHQFVDHLTTYVNGLVHTNGIESFWSLLKRTLKGTYVSVDVIHLFRYLDEQAFRFNHRILNDAQRFSLAIMGIVGKRLTYDELIAAGDAATI